jgi:hypothetical protein
MTASRHQCFYMLHVVLIIQLVNSVSLQFILGFFSLSLPPTLSFHRRLADRVGVPPELERLLFLLVSDPFLKLFL